jgi:hypothetical protein
VRQTIQFSPCKYEKTDPRKRVVKLRSTRNFIVYDDPEQVVKTTRSVTGLFKNLKQSDGRKRLCPCMGSGERESNISKIVLRNKGAAQTYYKGN